MKLQVAIDLLSTRDALDLLEKVHEYVDVIELGTPLIKQEGLAVVTAVKKAYPNKIVFADMKTMDAGALEADMAFKAGADQVSILAVADNSTIKGAAGREAGVRFSIAGGINLERIGHVEDAGAAVAVAGASIYGAKDPAAAAKALREKIKQLG